MIISRGKQQAIQELISIFGEEKLNQIIEEHRSIIRRIHSKMSNKDELEKFRQTPEAKEFMVNMKNGWETFYGYIDKSDWKNKILFHIASGIQKQEGEFVFVDNLKAAIDKSIAARIINLNENGFKTAYCCSGMAVDHGKREHAYIGFTNNIDIVESIAKSMNLEICNEKIIAIYFQGDDNTLENTWNDIVESLLKKKG